MDKGFEATINLMAVSTVGPRDLNEALEDLNKSRVPVVYLVDSFGAFYSEDIDVLARKYFERLLRRQSVFIATTTSSLPLQIQSRESSRALTIWTRHFTAWVGVRATVRWSF